MATLFKSSHNPNSSCSLCNAHCIEPYISFLLLTSSRACCSLMRISAPAAHTMCEQTIKASSLGLTYITTPSFLHPDHFLSPADQSCRATLSVVPLIFPFLLILISPSSRMKEMGSDGIRAQHHETHSSAGALLTRRYQTAHACTAN